jgi:hypothetical protein
MVYRDLDWRGKVTIALGVALNTVLMAPTQYAGVNFDSMCVFEGKILGAGVSGICEMTGNTDLGVAITSFFQLPSTDLGASKAKKLRSMILSGYHNGNVKLTIVKDNDESTEYTINLNGAADHRNIKVDLNSNDLGRYIGLVVENIAGSDFSIDAIDLLLMVVALEHFTRSTLCRNKGTFPLPAGEATATIV